MLKAIVTVAVALVLALPAGAAGRSCRVPAQLREGWPAVVRIDSYQGASCGTARAVARSLVDQIKPGKPKPHAAGYALSSYRCHWPRRRTKQGDPRHVANCHRGKRRVRIRFTS